MLLMPIVLVPQLVVVLILIFTSLGYTALPAIGVMLVVFFGCGFVAASQVQRHSRSHTSLLFTPHAYC